MRNTVEQRPHKAVEVRPHDEGCGTRFEIRGFEMLTCNAKPLGQGPNNTLYLWHILECFRFGCNYKAFVRDDYVFRLLVGIETPLVDNATPIESENT